MTTRIGIPTVDVLGVRVGVLTPQDLLDHITDIVETEQHAYVTFTNVHAVMECQRETSILTAHNNAAIVCPDGMPLVWASRYAGFPEAQRCYGPDCMLDICRLAAVKGWSIFLYGGKPGVAELLQRRLEQRLPDVRIVGTYSPPFRALTEEEIDEEITVLNASGADLIFVGLGAPKQERWMAARLAHLHAHVLFGVGAAFDFHSGLLSQAPTWMQRSGLEWLYRLAREPRRLAGRYLKNNPAFLARILRNPPRSIFTTHSNKHELD